MSDNLPAFLSEDPEEEITSAAAETPTPEPAPEPAPAVEPQPEPAPAAEPVAPVAAEPAQSEAAQSAQPAGEVQHVPLATFLDMRDQLKAAQTKLNAMESAQPQPQAPDPFEDPEAYAAHQQAGVERALKVNTFNTSKLIALGAHGEELVNKAISWAAQRANEDPGFQQRSLSHHHPVELAIQEMRRHELLTQIGDDTDADAYVRRRAAELGFVMPADPNPAPAPAAQPAPAAPATPQRVAPRPSNAAAPSAGLVAAPVARDGEATFNAMFNR